MEADETMKRTTIGILGIAVAVLLATPAWSNTLSVKGAAAIEGNFGLEVLMQAGTINPTYVRDNTPNGEATYRVQFWLDRSGIFMDNAGGLATRFVGFRAADENFNNGGGSPVTVFRGIFGRLAVDQPAGVARYTWRLGCRKDNGSFQYIGGLVMPDPGRKGSTREGKAASAPGANDGICRLYQGNSKYVANLAGERTNLDNDLHRIDFVQMGAISGFTDNPNDPVTNGPLYYDSFESYRATLP